MTTPLLAAPGKGGLWARVKDPAGYWVDESAWNRARAERSPVGTCRECGIGELYPDPTPPEHHQAGDESHLVWLSATCCGCGHQVALPNGKILKHSAARLRRPLTWEQVRDTALRGRKS